MKKPSLKKALGVLLVLAMLTSLAEPVLSAEETKEKAENKDPIVLLNGYLGWGDEEGINGLMPYFGGASGSITDFYADNGFEAYAPSSGSQSSSWDMACEIYARIVGTRVDYGEAHSAANGHSRYGRTYTKEQAICPNWGEKDESGRIQAIHIVAHSFGGLTARYLANMLEYGVPEEVELSGDDVSPLFKGGHKGWIRSITTLGTPHQSTTLYYVLDSLPGFLDFYFPASFFITALLSVLPGTRKLFNYHYEMWGFGNVPGEEENRTSFFKALSNRYKNYYDTAQHELTAQGNLELNKKLKICDDIYYFAYSFSTTEQLKINPELRRPKLSTNPLLIPFTSAMGIFNTDRTVNLFTCQHFTVADRDNDGMVSLPSAQHPKDEPFKDYDKDNIAKGVWNVMPVMSGDHGQEIGLLANVESMHEMYLDIANRAVDLEKADALNCQNG